MKVNERSAQVAGAAAGAAVATGAGVAAAKALLDRRRAKSRRYRLEHDEGVADGITRVAAGRADSAIDHLRGEVEDEEFATSIHEARKDLKKLRSVLRLVRAPLGDPVYRAENERFRDAAQLLSGARDAEVKLETLASLRERYGDRFPEADLAAFRDALEGERQVLARTSARDNGQSSTVEAAHRIEAGRDAIGEWPLEGEGFELIEDGLKRSYRRGRNRFADTAEDPTAENVHEWRKRVKDLWYHLRLIQDARPKKLKKAADQAHDLSDLLGDHHDLAVLREDALGRSGLIAGESLADLEELIERRQEKLVGDATSLAKGIYAEKPKKFIARIGGYWTDWR
jgi:CHAD domain-containing protein